MIESVEGASESGREQVSRQAPKTPRARMYYLDWMRITSIYLVVIYHVVQALDWIGLWCGYQQLQSTSFRCVALQIGMPMFFHISGRAQAMSRLSSLRVTAGRRFVRLILPFIICYIVLVPTWMWVHLRKDVEACEVRETEECGLSGADVDQLPDSCYRTTSTVDPDVAQNLIVFLFRFWTTRQCMEQFDPAWLWFLPILYLVTVSTYPLILWGETFQPKYVVPMVGWFSLQAFSILVVLVNGYSPYFVFFLAVPTLGTALLVIAVPFPPRDGEEDPATKLSRFVAIRICTTLHVVSTVGLVVNFRYADIDGVEGYTNHPLRAVPQMFMYPLFYQQGYYVARWWPEGAGGGPSKAYAGPPAAAPPADDPERQGRHASLRDDADARATATRIRLTNARLNNQEVPAAPICDVAVGIKFYKLIAIAAMVLVVFTGCPIGQWEFSSWPVYSASFHGNNDFYAIGYAISTWAWIGIANAIFQVYMEDVIHPRVHHHASASTIVVYIFHWVFIKFYVWFVILKFGLMYDFWKYFAVATTFGVGVGGSLLMYWLLLRTPSVGWLFGL